METRNDLAGNNLNMLKDFIFSVFIAMAMSEPASIGTPNIGGLTYTNLAFEAELERKYKANFIADVKAGNHCPSIMLTPEGMVQNYKDYIERGLLTEEQLRSACTVILEKLS